MKVLKVINNNVVSCIDRTGRESVAMGKGLGFGVRPGMQLCEDKVEKFFHLETQSETDRFKNLLASLTEEQLDLCTQIISYATENLGKALNPSLYLTLTDHICFAISRMKQGIIFQNALLTEVRTFYPREFAIGKYVISFIDQKLGITFPEDEAASIALHLVNAEFDSSLSETMKITQALHHILEILRRCPDLILDEKSLWFDELTVHLKFLVIRVFHNDEEDRPEPEFVEMIRRSHPKEFACTEKIAQYLEDQCHHRVSDENKAYLAVYIHRINNIYIKKEGHS